jgi:molecular chaperone HscA
MSNIGIDLGTTNSLVAVVMGGKARCLLDDDEEALTPSAVRYTDQGVLVGRPALDGAAQHAGTTVTSVKRFMGRSMDEARAEADQIHYALAEGDDRVVRIQVGDRAVTPIEVSAEILKALHRVAADCLLGNITGAVITVPAYFDDAQRQATRDAGKLAGLEVLRLLNEPTAAAIAYGLQEGSVGKYAIYDLGGGTFDISILELTDGVFQVLSTAGDTHLGGDDFDLALAAQLLDAAGQAGAGGGTLRTAVEAARAAKEALTGADTAEIDVTLGGTRVQRTLGREEFEALIRPTVDRTLTACAQALKDAKLAPADVDGVVLVGGSTRVPLVRRVVEEFFGKPPHCELDPDQVVALGAAIQADLLTGTSELADDLLLLDVVPLSLGLETMGGVVEKLIFRCTPIPSQSSETFTTHVDGQTAVDIHVLQGEREMASDCRSLGRFKLTGIPPMPAGLPRVKVDFTVDANGILTVSAKEEYTGVEANIEVLPSYGLEEDEIERMLEDAIDFAEADVDARMLIESRVEAEQVLAALKKALRDDSALLKDGEQATLDAIIADLEAAMQGEDRKRISALTERLDEASAPFAQRRIERDLQIALKGQHADQVAEKLDIADKV